LAKLSDWKVLKRVIGLARPYRFMFIQAIAVAILLALVTPLTPFLIRMTVDQYIAPGNLPGLNKMLVILMALIITQGILQYLFIYLSNWLGQQVIRNLRERVFNHVLRLQLRYFDRTPIGKVTTRTINDVETINDIFAQGIITIAADMLTIVSVITLMFIMNWRLTLVVLSTLPLMVLATYIFKEKVKVVFQWVRNELSRMNAFLQEHITGMKIVQTFTAEKREMERFREINNEYKKANIRAIWYYSIFFPVVEIITALALALMVWYGANEVVRNQATLGVLIAFFLYLNQLFRPIRMLADKFNTVQMGLVAAERVFRLLDREDFIRDNGSYCPDQIKGHIEVQHVWFAYEDQQYVLRDISFEVRPGQSLAIVGATGSGKTSIINILNRFYEFQQGKILLDGHDLRDYTLDCLHTHIGNVLQDVYLFSGSIYENITLRNPEISLDQVREAAAACGVDELIEQLPGKYDYDVHERGATLSLGQRQLIAFVRALIYNPSILILDEATSSIDRESEILIQRATEKVVENRTSIIIAHRLSTIQHVDHILVMDKGEIVEQGTHSELLNKNGPYRRLYDMQFKDQQKVA